MEDMSSKKDSFLNIMFAMMITDNKYEEKYLKVSDLQDLIEKINSVSDRYPYLHEYDMPDLGADAIKKNRHVDYVSLDNEIAFRMGAKEAEKIIKRNNNLVQMITNFAFIDTFNDDVMNLTGNTVVFDCHNPNTEYLLGYVDSGAELKENKIFTDGDVTILEENDFAKKVKVSNASYVIQSAYEDNRLVAGLVKANYVHPTFLTFLMFEVRDFYRDQLGSYECSKTKPSVLRKRLN
jgi:hypothetical protein